MDGNSQVIQYNDIILEGLYETYYAIRGLHALRREEKEHKSFWRQFWLRWDFGKLKAAHHQAFEDMFLDPDSSYFKSGIGYIPGGYINFESAVARDQMRFCRSLDFYSFIIENSPQISVPEIIQMAQFVVGLTPDYDACALETEIENILIKQRLLGMANSAELEDLKEIRKRINHLTENEQDPDIINQKREGKERKKAEKIELLQITEPYIRYFEDLGISRKNPDKGILLLTIFNLVARYEIKSTFIDYDKEFVKSYKKIKERYKIKSSSSAVAFYEFKAPFWEFHTKISYELSPKLTSSILIKSGAHASMSEKFFQLIWNKNTREILRVFIASKLRNSKHKTKVSIKNKIQSL